MLGARRAGARTARRRRDGSEVPIALDLEAYEEDDPQGPFTAGVDDRLVGRLDEHPFLPSELDDEESRPQG